MNNIYDFDFSRFLPGALTHDPKMVTLAKMLAAELLTTSGQLDNVLIYSRFDELPEELVDVLAYDMHVDWYDYSYPLKVKRDLVKNSVKVHKKMGTKYAVETALGSLWPQSEIEEWFNYGGEPHHFRAVCDVTEDRITASFSQLVNAVKMYKRLSSHLESVVYQTRISCIIQTHADYVVYKTPMTGRLKTGTYPYRNMRGGTAEAAIIVGTEAAGFIFNVPQAGTVPQRNVIFQGRKSHITAETALEMFKYRNIPAGVTEAGKTPQRSARGGVATADITAQTEAEGSTYAVPVAGTVPGRNTHQQTAGGSVTSQAEGTGFKYNTRLCGSPRKL